MKKQTVVILTLSASIILFSVILIKETGTNSPIKNLLRELNINLISDENDILTPVNDAKFEILKSKISQEEGTFGLYIKDMLSRKTYEKNTKEEFYPLSLFKLPIAYIVTRDVEKGDLKWEDTVIYNREDFFNQYGTIHSFGFGSEFELKKVVELMLRESDNAAPNILKRYLGEDYLNNEFKKVSGFTSYDLFDDELLTTPERCAYIIEGIFYKKWLSDESVNLLLSFLNPTSYDEALIPYLNESLTFYHKVGFSTGMYHDCGIIRGAGKDIILCLMSKNITEESYDRVNQYVAEFINSY